MGVIFDSWCFCKGVGKSEKMKASIFSGKAPAMARISVSGPNGVTSGTGFLIHRNLLLTTHLNLPSIAATETAEVRLQNGVAAALFPHRFFITSSVIDLTIVGLDLVDGDSNSQSQTQQPHYLKTCSKPNLDLGSVVYLLGYAAQNELKIGEGKLVVATDNLIKLSTDEMIWSPGSAGFDVQGNLAFMICDPRKLSTSPASNSSSSSSSLRKDNNKTLMMQFGIPIPVICDWLNQHWEGSLDEHTTKPKLPLIRLMSSGQKSERSCTSFTMRSVFKPNDSADVGTPSSSNNRDQIHPSSSIAADEEKEEETSKANPQGGRTSTHGQGIPTPEIYESPKLTSGPLRNETGQVHLLDINFPPRIPKAITFLPELNSLQGNNMVEEADTASEGSDAQIASTGSVNGALSEVISCSPPAAAHYVYNNHGYSSEEETMYSAETAESRNYPTPPRKSEFHHERVGRSQSCVSSSRWGTPQKSSDGRRAMLEKQRSFVHGKKMQSQGAMSQRSNDYYSPTVSSIMKKRNNSSEQHIFKPVPRPRAVSSSPRWAF
ncbi:hypothetical protein CARUB_v10013394mg [Capsella rubella]|uniref:Peptidase S1 domain-containing protein n=1 Tax=Capsella rubella TaxID=81985 RepID=R0I1N1_9BRAS|nr:uncharacterized protein LOC17893694 [Capsella rubella]EOA30273.1 hypothetical protein CARUB_v10013394mg [Capsella rubella]